MSKSTKKIKIYNTGELHTIWYNVFKNVLDISQDILREINIQSEKISKSSVIFNTNESTINNDNNRLQKKLYVNSMLLKSFYNNVHIFITENISKKLIPNDLVILKSLAGCQHQSPHTDYVPRNDLCDVLDFYEDDKVPLLMLIGIMPDTKIHIWTLSINLINKHSEDIQCINKINCKVIEIDKGDILVFRADLIHAGSDYDVENIRLHMYLDSLYVKRYPNKTWIISQKYNSNEKIKDIIIPFNKK